MAQESYNTQVGIVQGGSKFFIKDGGDILGGTATTRAAVRADGGDAAEIGSYYSSSAGKGYVKVANAGADTDWRYDSEAL